MHHDLGPRRRRNRLGGRPDRPDRPQVQPPEAEWRGDACQPRHEGEAVKTETLPTGTLRLQLQFTETVLRKNIGDVTHEDSLRHFPSSGNGVNWVLGHLVAVRSGVLGALGGLPVWSADECRPYDRHAPPLAGPAQARPLDEIWRAFDLTQKRLLELADRLTPDDLAR